MNESDSAAVTMRRRIARVLGSHWVSEPSGGIDTGSWCDCTCGLRITVHGGTRGMAAIRGDEHQAQAIIDDLGLTVERRFVYATDLARDDEPVTEDMATRVVGKWEEEK